MGLLSDAKTNHQDMTDFYLECESCLSRHVAPSVPNTDDMEHPFIYVYCLDCGHVAQVECKIDGISADGKISISIDPRPKLAIAGTGKKEGASVLLGV